MKNYIFLLAILVVQTIDAQSDTSLIGKTLQNYIDGSSYNRTELLESAFTKDATLYLTGRDQVFKRYSPPEYVDFFKNAEPGTFNGRQGTILSIEQIKDIATAKVEIAGPERNMGLYRLIFTKKDRRALENYQ